MQLITRKGTFDSGHRVLNERMKCFNLHGHTYLFELTFAFREMEDIGYALDFKEIKRVGCQWIDDLLDHGMILNPHDTGVIDATVNLDGKLWIMSLNGPGEYCNPSAENIAKEIFLAQEILFHKYELLKMHHLRLYETPNCYTDCFADSISDQERKNFCAVRAADISDYASKLGVVEYDDRKIGSATEPTAQDVDNSPPVKVAPANKQPAHSKGSGSSVGNSMGLNNPPGKGDKFAPEKKSAMFKTKPSSLTDDPSRHTWDFGTKWI